MVTIIPVDVDEDLVREGLQYAVAQRIDRALSNLQEVVKELAAAGLIEREDWKRVHEAYLAVYAEADSVLDYTKSFLDQWPVEDEPENE